MKILLEPSYWKRPANQLVEAMQARVRELVNDPAVNQVTNAYKLKDRLQSDGELLAKKFPRCKLADIKFTIQEFQEHQFFQMTHRNDNIAVSARCVYVLGKEDFFPGMSFYQPVHGSFGRTVIEF